ncbi:uncharacterized protein LOC144919016 [Branchiostoma floridae x Branchiostoma belcheri]
MMVVSSFLLIFSWIAFASTSIDLDPADQYGCTFDVGICGWTIEGPVYNGPGMCDHGWPHDAVHGVTDSGMYMCFFLEDLPMLGTTRARLVSPTINTTHPVVLSFYVGTVRPPNSTYLNVFVMNMDGTESLLWSTSDLLAPWQHVHVRVTQSGPYQVVIEGIPNPPFFPNFGIDDFLITVTDSAATTEAIQTHGSSTEVVTTTSSQDGTAIPTTNTQDTTIFPTTSTQDKTTFPMTSVRDTSTVHATSSREETTQATRVPTTKTTDSYLLTTLKIGISMYFTSKATSYFPDLSRETTKPSDPSKPLSTTSKLAAAPTKAAQRGDNNQAGANPVPIALGTTGGLLVVAIGAFAFWKKYAGKTVVSPENYPQDHDLLSQTELVRI